MGSIFFKLKTINGIWTEPKTKWHPNFKNTVYRLKILIIFNFEIAKYLRTLFINQIIWNCFIQNIVIQNILNDLFTRYFIQKNTCYFLRANLNDQ